MTRSELEHLIRACGAVADDAELIVIGSQAILGVHPDTSTELPASAEAGLYPRNHPERAIHIDWALGEGSYFHQRFGYYVQGSGPQTAVLPRGWESRLVSIKTENTDWVTGWCLEKQDLAISKYVAGREKDQIFTAAMACAGLTSRLSLQERLVETKLADELRNVVRARIDSDFPR